MTFLRDALAIFRLEATLFQRFPKLKISAVGVMLIPALYALIYLASVQDPGAHTGARGDPQARCVRTSAGHQRLHAVALPRAVADALQWPRDLHGRR